jgi:hypothetical protein
MFLGRVNRSYSVEQTKALKNKPIVKLDLAEIEKFSFGNNLSLSEYVIGESIELLCDFFFNKNLLEDIDNKNYSVNEGLSKKLIKQIIQNKISLVEQEVSVEELGDDFSALQQITSMFIDLHFNEECSDFYFYLAKILMEMNNKPILFKFEYEDEPGDITACYFEINFNVLVEGRSNDEVIICSLFDSIANQESSVESYFAGQSIEFLGVEVLHGFDFAQTKDVYRPSSSQLKLSIKENDNVFNYLFFVDSVCDYCQSDGSTNLDKLLIFQLQTISAVKLSSDLTKAHRIEVCFYSDSPEDYFEKILTGIISDVLKIRCEDNVTQTVTYLNKINTYNKAHEFTKEQIQGFDIEIDF